VAEGKGQEPRPFDVKTIHYLVKLMSAHDLSEIDLYEGESRIRLRRGPHGVVAHAATPALAPVALPAPAAPPAAPAQPAARPAEAPAAAGKKLLEIKAPTPGTFYTRPNPDAKPFVAVGSPVKPETVVCTIEAMKVFNEIQAEVTGVIAEVCLEDKQPVEYGQVLFRVEPG
jgi:acetyl-CoA carboxylase biotin carboxyl carrier protein